MSPIESNWKGFLGFLRFLGFLGSLRNGEGGLTSRTMFFVEGRWEEEEEEERERGR